MKNSKKLNNNASSVIYVAIRYVAFIGASIVSAIFNLLLFQGMAPAGDVFLLFVMSSISVVLELTKISTVITANLFHDIYKKTLIPAIQFKKRVFYTFYVLLTLLSITASLGFTFTLNDRMNSISTTQLDQVENLQTKLESLQVRELNIDKMEDGIATQEQDIVSNTITLQSSTITNNVQSNQALRVANDDYNTAQNELNRYTDAKTQYDRIQELLSQEDALKDQRRDADDVEAVDAQLASIEQQLETTRYAFDQYASLLGLNERTFNSDYEIVKSTRDNAQRNLDRVKASNAVTADVTLDSSILDSSRANITTAIASLDVDKGIFLQDINQYIIDTNPESDKVIASITEAETYLVQLSKDIKENAGVNVMFREFGKLFRTDPALITLIILMFVSILIELTIYQTSPDLKPTRKILFFFRNHLADVDMPKLFVAFDEENIMWTDDFDPVKAILDRDKQLEDLVNEEITPIEQPLVAIPVEEEKPVKEKKPRISKPKVVKKPEPKKKSRIVNTVIKEEKVTKPAVKKEKTKATPKAKSAPKPKPAPKPKKEEVPEAVAYEDVVKAPVMEQIVIEQPVVEETIVEPVSLPIPAPEPKPIVKERVIPVHEEEKEEKPVAVNVPAPDVILEEKKEEVPVRQAHSQQPEPAVAQPVEAATVHSYRFGKATEEIMVILQKFIGKLFSDLSQPYLYDADKISQELKIKPALGKLFMKRLQELVTPEKKPLIYLGDDGLYYSNYDKEFILAYVTAPINK